MSPFVVVTFCWCLTPDHHQQLDGRGHLATNFIGFIGCPIWDGLFIPPIYGNMGNGWWFGTMEFWMTFPSYWEWRILGIIIPTDFHIFQMGRYTTNQLRMVYGTGFGSKLGRSQWCVYPSPPETGCCTNNGFTTNLTWYWYCYNNVWVSWFFFLVIIYSMLTSYTYESKCSWLVSTLLQFTLP